jgi:hypothetical protein
MAQRRKRLTEVSSIVHDGELTQAEALTALRIAAKAATEALPAALAKCQTDSERQKVQADRDTVLLAYLNSLQRTLVNTSQLFETIAESIEGEAKNVRESAENLKSTAEAINLLVDLVRLAGSLALAFA